MTRWRVWTVGSLIVCVTIIIVAVVEHQRDDRKGGLSSQKIAELAHHGVTPEQYLRIKERGAAHQAALHDEPPTDPNVVGPRLIGEEHGPELSAWKQFYGAALHTGIAEAWSVQAVGEKRTIVTLELVAGTGRGDIFSEPAKWAINVSLTRPLTSAEERIVHGSHAVEALNQMARKLEGLPMPHIGLSLPVDLFGDEVLSPGLHVVVVDVFPARRYESWLIMRRGILDEPLLRGKGLAKRAPLGVKYLRLSKHVKVFEEAVAFGEAKAGPRRRSSIYELNRLFNSGPVPLILGWKSGAHNLHDLLRRPVQELTILS